jgi:nicotinamidase-related amidase
LERNRITLLAITGGRTEYCVDTTCRRATTLGYDVVLVSDGHLTRDNVVLKATQIIAHHNTLLAGFATPLHRIQVTPAEEVAL